MKFSFFHRASRLSVFLVIFMLTILSSPAQRYAVKTNVINDVALSPNIGFETALSSKWTLEIPAEFNFWTVDGRKWKHWLVQPGVRYWFCQSFAGHFIGFHALGGQFNIGHINLPFKFLGTDFSELKENRWQGWMAGAGVAYGYTWILSRRWSLEAELGIGWIYSRHDTYSCKGCGKKKKKNVPHNYFGPTKTAVNIVYNF